MATDTPNDPAPIDLARQEITDAVQEIRKAHGLSYSDTSYIMSVLAAAYARCARVVKDGA
jgi:hypothetical protein